MGGGMPRARIKPLRQAPVAHSTAAAGSVRPTPLLVSPLKGGRDELGSVPVPACAGMTVGRASSCLRRNDGRGRAGSCLRRNDGTEWGWARRDTCGERGSVAWARACSGLFLIGRILGDPEGVPIWSRCLAAFRFVRICSGLFRGDPAWVVVPGMWGWLVDREVGIARTFVLLRVW